MSTPVLSKKQQKTSLSAKKGPAKGLRNVLKHPEQNYWPLLKSEHCPEFEKFFREIISPLKSSSEKIPWSKYRFMSKEERLEVKKKKQESKENAVNKDTVAAVITGINAVTRSMEKNKIASVLLDANVDPPFLVKHIVMMAQYKKVPILLVPFLKTALQETRGYSSTVFALKSTVSTSTDHHFQVLQKKILELSLDYPPPSNLLHMFQNEEIEEGLENDVSSATDKILQEKQKNDDNSKKEEVFKLPSNIYTYRSSTKERAFVPPNVQLDTACNKQDLDDFIGFGDDSSEIEEDVKIGKQKRYTDMIPENDNKYALEQLLNKEHECSTTKSSTTDVDIKKSQNFKTNSQKRKISNITYLPLKVSRIQGNKNRVKATKLPKRKRK